MKRLFKISLVLILALVAWLTLWPVSIAPVAWNPPAAPALDGPYAVNNTLATVTRLAEGLGPKPEDIAVDAAGRFYAGFEDGRIMRWDESFQTAEVFVTTAGRPLGLHFDAAGNLLVADSYKGLLRISTKGEIEVLATEHGGLPFRFTNDVEVAADGTIYFTDASHKFGQLEFVEDLMEHGGHGRLLAYHPASRTTELLLDGLQFANGVALDPEQQYLVVNETGAYRTLRYWLAGPRKGEPEIFIDNLPGFPDGIEAGTGGIFWLALASPRNPLMDRLGPHPALRRVVMRLPAALRPKPVRHAFVLGVNGEGRIVHNLQDPDGAYAPVTSAVEQGGKLYFGSILESALGRIDRPAPVE